MSAALKIRGLCKSYGRTVALDKLDLTVPKGVICGFGAASYVLALHALKYTTN